MSIRDILPFEKGIEKEKFEILASTFIKEDYFWLVSDLKPNTTAIDIGAYIGDTALYFAMQNMIKQVLAYEPYPKTFKELAENIKNSKRKDKIKIFNQAVGKPGSNYKIAVNESTEEAYESLSEGGKQEITVLGLDRILEEAHADNLIIKMNCEGGETFIIDSGLDLKNVYKMQILVYTQFSSMRTLQQILNAYGFQTRMEPKKLPDLEWLYAWRP
ncbi:MAG: FkbM family methyltransferase [Candidatus Micrarchaeaceae archaeon]